MSAALGTHVSKNAFPRPRPQDNAHPPPAAMAFTSLLRVLLLAMLSWAAAGACLKKGEYCGTGPVVPGVCCPGLRCGGTSGPGAVCK